MRGVVFVLCILVACASGGQELTPDQAKQRQRLLEELGNEGPLTPRAQATPQAQKEGPGLGEREPVVPILVRYFSEQAVSPARDCGTILRSRSATLLARDEVRDSISARCRRVTIEGRYGIVMVEGFFYCTPRPAEEFFNLSIFHRCRSLLAGANDATLERHWNLLGCGRVHALVRDIPPTVFPLLDENLRCLGRDR